MHFDIHCQACASRVRVRVWVGVRVSVEFSYLFNQAIHSDVTANSICLLVNRVVFLQRCEYAHNLCLIFARTVMNSGGLAYL